MKEIVVISGKGGTGKTSITASFAYLANKNVLADCDVDAADLHLIADPQIKKKEIFFSGKTASIMQKKCTSCGECQGWCEFGAISSYIKDGKETYVIDPISCEGCGVCHYFCKQSAIRFEEDISGEWFVSDTRFGPMVHARLGIAAENSGKLVSLVRNQAKAIATKTNLDMILIDGPPGIGCPVIASITGTDVVLIVTEPTLSGKHDLARIAKLTRHFNVKTYVCINKYDINPQIATEIEAIASELEIKTIGRVPYSSKVTKAQIEKKTILEYDYNATTQEITKMWNILLNEISC